MYADVALQNVKFTTSELKEMPNKALWIIYQINEISKEKSAQNSEILS